MNPNLKNNHLAKTLLVGGLSFLTVPGCGKREQAAEANLDQSLRSLPHDQTQSIKGDAFTMPAGFRPGKSLEVTFSSELPGLKASAVETQDGNLRIFVQKELPVPFSVANVSADPASDQQKYPVGN